VLQIQVQHSCQSSSGKYQPTKEDKDMQTIDPRPHQIRLTVAERRLGAARRGVQEAEEQIAAIKKAARDEISRRMTEGATTGNELQDEIIYCIGFEPTIIEKFLAFSKKLEENAGKEFLLVFHWSSPMFSVCSSEKDNKSTPREACLFGVLSGERLKLVRGDIEFGGIISYAIQLPLIRHVKDGFDDKNENLVPSTEPVILNEGFGDGWLHPMLRYITGDKEYGEPCEVYFFGGTEEIPLSIHNKARRLHGPLYESPTAKEVVQAANI
jgi:hypothetical protein